MRPRVTGYCPMGCGRTLELALGTGFIVCTNPACLEPNAVTMILNDSETEHIVEFDTDSFLSRHPLHERVHTKLSDCQFQVDLANELTGPPVPPGVYRAVRKVGGEYDFIPMPKEAIHG